MKYTVTKDAEAEIEFKGKEGMAGETPRTVVEVRPSDVASPRANATTMMLRMEGWMALAELINHRVAIGRSVARDAPSRTRSRGNRSMAIDVMERLTTLGDARARFDDAMRRCSRAPRRAT